MIITHSLQLSTALSGGVATFPICDPVPPRYPRIDEATQTFKTNGNVLHTSVLYGGATQVEITDFGGGAMVKQAVRVLTISLAFLAIGGFAFIYSLQIVKAWPVAPHIVSEHASRGADQNIDDPYSYVATTLASLVGAVVAVMFGRPATGTQAKGWDWASILSIAYSYVYVFLGVASLIVWVRNPQAPVLVKTLALSFFGLAIPVITAFLKPGGFISLLRGDDVP